MHRTPSELAVGAAHHRTMVRRLRELFPSESNRVRRRMQNRIAKVIRTCGQDVYAVVIGSGPVYGVGYTSQYTVEAFGKTVYISITVD